MEALEYISHATDLSFNMERKKENNMLENAHRMYAGVLSMPKTDKMLRARLRYSYKLRADDWEGGLLLTLEATNEQFLTDLSAKVEIEVSE